MSGCSPSIGEVRIEIAYVIRGDLLDRLIVVADRNGVPVSEIIGTLLEEAMAARVALKAIARVEEQRA